MFISHSKKIIPSLFPDSAGECSCLFGVLKMGGKKNRYIAASKLCTNNCLGLKENMYSIVCTYHPHQVQF